jgi:hypothetical protein
LATPSLTTGSCEIDINRYKTDVFNSLIDDGSDGTDEHDVEDDNDEDYEGGVGIEGESDYGWTDDLRPQKR